RPAKIIVSPNPRGSMRSFGVCSSPHPSERAPNRYRGAACWKGARRQERSLVTHLRAGLARITARLLSLGQYAARRHLLPPQIRLAFSLEPSAREFQRAATVGAAVSRL